jgi:hypothetical protein
MKQAAGGLGVALLAVLCCGGPVLIDSLAAAVGTAAVVGGVAALGGVVALGLVLMLARRALLRRRAAACAPAPLEGRAKAMKARG